jgi:hypothetical protein
MRTVFLDASVGGRDGLLGKMAAARGYSVKPLLEEGVDICVVASSAARKATSVKASKRTKRMMLPVSSKQTTTADVRDCHGFFQFFYCAICLTICFSAELNS